ncbi:MAG: FadR family transcriptional regulator [Thermomicrobiales bacterium]|nr:FadR family transcriptional regulator [Thermomicrobiales bacterium]
MRHPRLSDRIVMTLAGRIIEGQMPASTVLPPEPQLCDEFGVSRTVIREAVARMAADGLVQVRQGSGTVVLPHERWNDLSPDLLRARTESGLIGDLVPDLLETRRIVEVEAAGLTALRRTAAHLADLERLLADMAASLDDTALYNAADIAFHETLISATGNILLLKMMRPVNQVRRIGSLLTARDIAVARQSLAGHREIHAAVAERQPAAARAAMDRHIGQFERDLAHSLLGHAAVAATIDGTELEGDGA